MSVPYAIRTLNAATADNAINAQNLGGMSSDNFVLTTDSRLTDARTPTAGSANYIQNTSSVQSDANFNVDGTGTASIFDATTQFQIGGLRVLSVPGTGNIFAGVNAGISNATGANNSFLGEDAGRDNNSGTDNSFFGVQSGRQNTSGGNNTFIGVNTGYGNTAGHSNAFVGMQAGQSNTIGHNNSFFGYVAGLNNTTGNFNSALGSNANVGNNLSFATAIGSGAVVNASDTIVLGKQSGTYDGVSRPADTIQIPGNLNVSGTIAGNIDGSSLTNISASNITTGTLADARLSSNVATLTGAQTFTGPKTFSGGIDGSGAGLTDLNASNISTGTLDNARLGAISSANIADGAITETKLGASAVTTTKIADSAVTTAKIADAAVTAAKIGSNQVVKSLNSLTDNVNLAAGANVSITPSGNTLTIAAASTSQWTTAGSNIFYSSGNVGIGTDTPDVSLRVHHSSSNVGSVTSVNHQLADLALALRNSNNTNGNMSLISFQDASGFGNAQIGAVQTSQLNHSAELVFLTRNGGATGERLRIKSDGVVVLNTLGTAGGSTLCRNASNQIAACSSSLRYKTNIAPFSFGLNLVQRLRPIRFEWKEGGMKDVGFGAEDVAAIEPLLVTYNQKGEVEGVKYDRFSAVLVNAVKEQQSQIEAQQLQLAAQQKQLESQQRLIESLKRVVCRQNPKVDMCR